MTAFRAGPDDYERLKVCPLCGSAPRDFASLTALGDRFEAERAVLCRGCGLVFLDPRLSPDALARYYRSDAFSQEVRGSGRPSPEALAYRDMRAERRWRLIRSAIPSEGRCLEVGCGAGNFLRVLEESGGYRAAGIDPSTGFVEHARRAGLEAYPGHFPEDLPDGVGRGDGSGGEGFDLIFMFHVLEHVPDPLSTLRHVRAHLAPGGLFALEYPDVELAARRRFLPHTYFERAHLFDFSRATLEAYLARAGLRVKRAIFEERVKPYDRNVVLICEEGAAGPALPSVERAGALERTLRAKLALSRPLMPLRPLWKRLKAALKSAVKGESR